MIVFAAISAPSFGVLRACPVDLLTPRLRIFLQTPQFNYALAAGVLLDELCWGAGASFSSELEAALVQLVVAVGEDLEGAIARLRPVLSLVAGAAQESDHMLTQMKKDIVSALQNSHRSLAVGRLHQFLEQLQSRAGDVSSLMQLPQSFQHASAAFFSAKSACLAPSSFRRRLSDAVAAAAALRKQTAASSAVLDSFIFEASKSACTDDSVVTAAEIHAAMLLKPMPLSTRPSSLLFMPVLSVSDLQVSAALCILNGLGVQPCRRT
jgi:hypothetical protein